jgi:peptidoglycan/xylan/chitin deacetylase (PgdA/CDA1 family)
MLFAGYFGISFAMAFIPCSNFHHQVYCRGNSEEKSVSITFDDGPDPEKTQLILEALKKHDVQATFFCIGSKIAGNENLLQRINDAGHLVGNHSFSHSNWFSLFSPRKIRTELMETDRLIKNTLGKSPLFFRPPFGVINPMVSKALEKMPWRVVCWNIRSLDTLTKNPLRTRQNILKKLRPGSIILLHDHTEFTKSHLHDLLTGIRDAGYRVVPLDKMLKLTAYAV